MSLVHVVFKANALLQDFEFPKKLKDRSGEGSLRIAPGGSADLTAAELAHLKAKGVPMTVYEGVLAATREQTVLSQAATVEPAAPPVAEAQPEAPAAPTEAATVPSTTPPQPSVPEQPEAPQTTTEAPAATVESAQPEVAEPAQPESDMNRRRRS